MLQGEVQEPHRRADVLPPARVDAVLEALWRLEDCPRIGSLLDLFTV